MRDIRLIKNATVDPEAEVALEQGEDPYLKFKNKLTEVMNEIKDKVKTAKDLNERVGKSPEGFKLKQEIVMGLKEAREIYDQTKAAYEKDEADFAKGRSKAKDRSTLDERKTAMEFIEKDLEWMEFESK